MGLYYLVLFVILCSSFSFVSEFRKRTWDVATATTSISLRNNTKTTPLAAANKELVARQYKHTSGIIRNHAPKWLQTYHAWHAEQRAQLAALDTELADNNASIDTIRNSTQHFRFLVVVCLQGMQCGGLSDRIKAIPYWLIIANKTKRILMINWNKSNINLEMFWMPPPGGMDWSIPKDDTVLSRLFYDPSLHIKKSCLVNRKHRVTGKDREKATAGLHQIVCANHQTYHFEKSPDDVAMYQTERHNNSYGYVFRTLFQPSRGFGTYLEKMLQGPQLGLELDKVRYTTKEPFLAVHIRSRYPIPWKKWKGRSIKPVMDDPKCLGCQDALSYIADHAVDKIIAKFVERNHPTVQYSARSVINDIPPIYVASDSSDVIRYLKYNSTLYGAQTETPNRTVTIGNITVRSPRIIGLVNLVRPHIEYINIVSNEDEKERSTDIAHPSDLYPVFLDLWMLSASSCIAHGIGGYGKLGALLRMPSDCTFVHRKKKVYKKVVIETKDYYRNKRLSLFSSPSSTS